MKSFKLITSLVLIVLVSIFVFTLTIDGLVKGKIEESGSNLLSTKVKIDDVDISIFNSDAEIDGFKIYNPEGFSDEVAISFNDIELDLHAKSLLADTIVIDQMFIEQAEIFFEQIGGNTNLGQLNSNLSVDDSKSDSKSIIINSFVLENIDIKILSELEKEREVKGHLNRLELNNVGRTGSNSIDDVMHQVLGPVIEKAVVESVKSGVLDKIENTINDFISN